MQELHNFPNASLVFRRTASYPSGASAEWIAIALPGVCADFADLSAVDRTFLIAMAQDVHPSKLAAIASRMGVDTNYASQYRARLIDAGIIQPAGYGLVTFTVPYLREYLQDHAATMGLDRLKLDRPAQGLL